MRSIVIDLPRGARGRNVYQELRNLGFVPSYALEAVNTLEGARSQLARWAMVQRVLGEDPDGAREWLEERGYC